MLAVVTFCDDTKHHDLFLFIYVLRQFLRKQHGFVKTEYIVIEAIERAFSRRREWSILKKKKRKIRTHINSRKVIADLNKNNFKGRVEEKARNK